MTQPSSILKPPPQPPIPEDTPRRPRLQFRYGPPELPRRRTPPATAVFMAISIIAFALTTVAGGLKSADVLLDFGASYGPYIRAGEYWRLVSATFLHGGIAHLTLNMLGLYVLGSLLERVYGYGLFALIYVGAGIGGQCLSMLASNDVAVGASGAIMGIAGAMVATGFLHPEAIPPRWRRVFGLRLLPYVLADLLLGVLINLAPATAYRSLGMATLRIDNWAHLGGIFTGLVLAGLIAPPKLKPADSQSPEAPPERHLQWIVVLPAAVVAAAILMAAVHYPRSRAVTRLLQQALQSRAAQRSDEELKLLKQAERLNPYDERTREQLGLFYLQQNQVPQAIEEYRRLLSLNRESVEAKLGLAQAYEKQGDEAKAAQYLRGIEKALPQDGEAQYALAGLFAEHKMYPEAIEHFQQALSLSPNLAGAHNDLAWLYATADNPRFRDPEKALEHARLAVELNHWKEPAFIDTLAEALYANKDYSEAVRVQAKTLALDPKNREYQEHMARYRKAAGV